MVETHAHFVNRLKGLGNKHAQLAQGYTTRIDHNGIVTAVPKRRRRTLPIKGMLMLAIGFIGFKTFMLAAVGPVTYAERLAKLEAGTSVERLGARALGMDPVTQALANLVGPILR